jgi:hypothetical protein
MQQVLDDGSPRTGDWVTVAHTAWVDIARPAGGVIIKALALLCCNSRAEPRHIQTPIRLPIRTNMRFKESSSGSAAPSR